MHTHTVIRIVFIYEANKYGCGGRTRAGTKTKTQIKAKTKAKTETKTMK